MANNEAQARVQYTAGQSHNARGYTFRKNEPKIITNLDDINYFKTAGGFDVQIIKAPATPPPPPDEERNEEEEDDEAAAARLEAAVTDVLGPEEPSAGEDAPPPPPPPAPKKAAAKGKPAAKKQ